MSDDSEISFDATAGLIYESVLDPPRLQEALGAMVRLPDGDNAIFEASQSFTHLGILALSGSGSLTSANRRGEALVRRGEVLSLWQGTLVARDPNLNTTLGAKLRQAAAGQVVHLALPDRPGQCSLCLTLMPTPRSESSARGDQSTAVIVLIADTRPHRVATVEQLMELFHLTRAEARLVRALCLDEDLDCYAAHEGLKKATVRTHLQSALAKTGTG